MLLNQDKIKETIREFFEKMTFDIDISFIKAEEGVFFVSLKTEEPKILIGQNGQTLFEIQHLLKAVLRRKIKENFYLDIDINDYKKRKNEYLKETARSFADEVSLTKKEKTLAPMPAYERRIVHMELSERKDVKTESFGQGEERRIVIKPSAEI